MFKKVKTTVKPIIVFWYIICLLENSWDYYKKQTILFQIWNRLVIMLRISQ